MPDSVLPSSGAAGATADGTARIGTPTDKSWAGWAISSFTNKLTAAEGEIRPTSDSGKITQSTKSSDPSKTLRPTPQPLARSVSDQAVPALEQSEEQKETEDIAGDDDDDDDDDADPFSSMLDSKPDTPAQKQEPIPYNDGGEPDFAGWLAAQSKAKPKRTLPKGLNKSSTTKGLPSRTSTATKSTTKPKRIVAPAKVNDAKPKESSPVPEGNGASKNHQPKDDKPKDVQPRENQPESGQLNDEKPKDENDDNDDDDDWGGF